MRIIRSCAALSLPILAIALVVPDPAAWAHEARFPLSAAKLSIKTRKSGKRSFVLKVKKEAAIRAQAHDPRQDVTSLAIRGIGGTTPGGSGLIQLDRTRWAPMEKKGAVVGYQYRDKSGSRGGITRVVLKNGSLHVVAKGKNWQWRPGGKHDSIAVEFRIAEELYCAEVTGRAVKKNKKDFVKRAGRPVQGAVASRSAGTGSSSWERSATTGTCSRRTDARHSARPVRARPSPSPAPTRRSSPRSSTARCTVVPTACATTARHPAGNLDLTAGSSYDALFEKPGNIGGYKLIQVTDPETSLLYLKLAAKTLGTPDNVGTPMPQNAPALSEAHLQAVYEWIRGGAPRDTVVLGTQAALATCLPEPDPLNIDPVPPPARDVGFQLASTPRFLENNSESEVCYSTYYDLSSLVPEWAIRDCPPGLSIRGPLLE